jgi:hypothetical protein
MYALVSKIKRNNSEVERGDLLKLQYGLKVAQIGKKAPTRSDYTIFLKNR